MLMFYRTELAAIERGWVEAYRVGAYWVGAYWVGAYWVGAYWAEAEKSLPVQSAGKR